MIKINKEPREYYERFHVYEKCYFCGIGTDTWEIHTNTPICANCAKKHKKSEIKKTYEKYSDEM